MEILILKGIDIDGQVLMRNFLNLHL